MDRHIPKTSPFTIILLCCAIAASFLHADVKANGANIISPEEAAKLAAKLANDEFQKAYGHTPFGPESYTARFVESRWHWGEIDPAGIGGCSAEVEFNMDGSGKSVKVAFHTDQLQRDRPIFEQRKPHEKRAIPEIDVRKAIPEINVGEGRDD